MTAGAVAVVVAPPAVVSRRLQDLIAQERLNVRCLIVLAGDAADLAPELALVEELAERVGLQAQAIQVLLCDEALAVQRHALTDLTGGRR